MKGNDRLLESLNSLLADELTSINQYMVHAEMCGNWGYEKLHRQFQDRAINEMNHAEMLINHILFLEGIPVVSVLNKIKIGSDVAKQLENDHSLEAETIKDYNAGIMLANEVNDSDTREVLESILMDEDLHIDNIKALQDQINQMTLTVFLSAQSWKNYK